MTFLFLSENNAYEILLCKQMETKSGVWKNFGVNERIILKWEN